MRVTFNLTFPALPCEALLLDAGDVSGKWQTESKLAVARCAFFRFNLFVQPLWERLLCCVLSGSHFKHRVLGLRLVWKKAPHAACLRGQIRLQIR